jgi:DDE superfamily endonuclease
MQLRYISDSINQSINPSIDPSNNSSSTSINQTCIHPSKRSNIRLNDYTARCAGCNRPATSICFRNKRAGKPIPKNAIGNLVYAPHQSVINNRVCDGCSTKIRRLLKAPVYVEIDIVDEIVVEPHAPNEIVVDKVNVDATDNIELVDGEINYVLPPPVHVLSTNHSPIQINQSVDSNQSVESVIIPPFAPSFKSNVAESSSADSSPPISLTLHEAVMRVIDSAMPPSSLSSQTQHNIMKPIIAKVVEPVLATIVSNSNLNNHSSMSQPKRAAIHISQSDYKNEPIQKRQKILKNYIVLTIRDKRKYVNKYRAGAISLDGSDSQRHRMIRWCKTIDDIDALALDERVAESRCRNDGGGRKPLLHEVEKDIKEWVMKQRKGNVAFSVSVMSIIAYAKEAYLLNSARSLTYNWVSGFMARNRLSFRRGTTNKRIEVNQDVVAQYRINEQDKIFSKSTCLSHVFNMDETGVNYDCAARCTVDETGASSVPIDTSGHEKTRSTVVLVVSASGIKLPPLIIHRHAMPRLNVTGSNQQLIDNAAVRHRTITEKKIIIDVQTSTGMEKKEVIVFECENPTAWMNTTVMELWFDEVFDEFSEHGISRLEQRVLYMDNMSAHTDPDFTQHAIDQNVDIRMLPPNCTPLLQPLDHSINGLFKRSLHTQWLAWFRKLVASGDKGKTIYGNWKVASRDEFNRWVAAAWESISSSAIVKAFEHSLTGEATLQAAKERLKGKEPIVIRPAANRSIKVDATSERISQQELEEFDDMVASSVTLDNEEDINDDAVDSVDEVSDVENSD